MSPQEKSGNRGVYFTASEWAGVRDAAYALRISANEYVRRAVREKMDAGSVVREEPERRLSVPETLHPVLEV